MPQQSSDHGRVLGRLLHRHSLTVRTGRSPRSASTGLSAPRYQADQADRWTHGHMDMDMDMDMGACHAACVSATDETPHT